jgi:hypothetical protein
MSKHEAPARPNEEMMPPVQDELVIDMPEHIEGYAPLGHHAVVDEEKRFAKVIQADWHEQRAVETMTAEIEQGDPLRASEVRRRMIGQLAITKKTEEGRASLLDEYKQSENDDFYEAGRAYNKAGIYEARRDDELTEIRKELGAIHEAPRYLVVDGTRKPSPVREQLNDYLRRETPALFQEDYRRWVKGQGADAIKRGVDRVEWLSQTSDELLVNFLQWHNDRTEKMNADPAFQQQVREKKEGFKAAIMADMARGDDGLPPEAAQALQKVDGVRIIAGDIFDMSMKSLLGQYRPGRNQIIVGEDFDDETFDHEMRHATLGRFRNELMNEALTEHTMLASRNGDYQTMDPDLREDEGAYAGYRRANSAILNSGISPVPFSKQLAAYIEGDDGGPKSTEFRQELNDAYGGIDVMRFVEDELGEGMKRELTLRPDRPLFEQENAAAGYVTSGVAILGMLAKGMKARDLRVKWTAMDPGQSASWIEHLDKVVAYVEKERAVREPRRRAKVGMIFGGRKK